MRRNSLSFSDRDFFIGSFAMAVLAVAACNGSAGDPDEGDLLVARDLSSGGQAPRDASGQNVNDDGAGQPNAGVDTDGDGACTAIGPPVGAALPRVASAGAPATTVASEIAALLAARESPIALGAQTIAMQNLFCSKTFTPLGAGATCSLDVSIDGGAPVEIGTPSPDLAESLFGALIDGGASACQDFAHRDSLHLSHVVINLSKGSLEFDDASQYSLPPSPNVRASGAEAAAVVAAMESANINDCDPSRTAFVVCNKQAETPACSTTFFPLEQVGESALVNICLPPLADAATVQLGAPEALTLWNAISGAAAASGYAPLHGTIEQATIINAKHFTWDGTSVGFLLTADNPVVPPPRR